MKRFKAFGVVGCVVLAGAVAGCGGGGQNPAHITGTVRYNGQPLKAGNLAFYHAEKGIYSASIDKDGKYELKDAPEGEMIVCVDTEIYNPEAKQSTYGAAPKTKGGNVDMKKAMQQGTVGVGTKASEKQLKKEAEEVANAYHAGSSLQPMSSEEKAAIYTKIPAKYMDKAKTDLRIVGTKGKSIADLDLKD